MWYTNMATILWLIWSLRLESIWAGDLLADKQCQQLRRVRPSQRCAPYRGGSMTGSSHASVLNMHINAQPCRVAYYNSSTLAGALAARGGKLFQGPLCCQLAFVNLSSACVTLAPQVRLRRILLRSGSRARSKQAAWPKRLLPKKPMPQGYISASPHIRHKTRATPQ